MWREEQTTDTVGVASGLGEAFIWQKITKYKCPRGKVSKINRGVWCPRRAAGFVKEGQCSRRKGPGKGRSPVAARAPRWGPGARGGGLSSGFVYLLAHGARLGWSARHPGSTAVSRVRISSGQRVRQLWRRGLPLRSLPGPTRTPACMHGKEPGLPVSSHTPTPVESLVKGDVKGRGDDDDKGGGGSRLVTIYMAFSLCHLFYSDVCMIFFKW